MHRLARNDMIIDKNIKSKVNIDYLFIEGKVKIDAKYFINQINQNCHVSNTHIVGEMTNFNFFNTDKKFEEFLVVVLKELDKHVFLRKYSFKEAWGYKQGFGHRTTEHDHIPNYLSGVLYLTNGDQKLLFKEINQEITPSVGKFVIFSSFLKHRAERSLSKEYKYGIAFNFSFNNSYATD